MHTDQNNTNLVTPVAFRNEFNSFQKITSAQAWSLFFTASNRDKLFVSDPKAGRFLTYSLGATVLAFVLLSTVFTGV